ncbi:MAG: hypothetical protein K9G40_00255 [Crocinitomicaceae bacterium]|nr:hypothetical protein [Crocinitomicaceae bacterium]MCF8433215.1 hypothetical protein [Crocinitomicaceae bacterium]
MKLLMKLWYWLRSFFRPAPPACSGKVQVPEQDSEEFRFSIISEIPELPNKDCIYILNEGYIDESLSFVCPCGCDSIIELNLLEDSKPLWRYNTDRNKITISPSVWRTVGCKSHFFIRKGKVEWAQD